MQIATVLSQQFAARGLQFFKVNRTITHVSVARPHYLDLEATPVSEGVKKIVEFINAHPRSTRRQLVDALAPSPAPAPIPVNAAEGAAAPAAVEATPEQTALISDLHWLVHQGHVIEFANGVLETAKKPVPKPPKPAPAPAPAPPGTEASPATAADTGSIEPAATTTEPPPVPAGVEEHLQQPPIPLTAETGDARQELVPPGNEGSAEQGQREGGAAREEQAEPPASAPGSNETPVVPVESPS